MDKLLDDGSTEASMTWKHSVNSFIVADMDYASTFSVKSSLRKEVLVSKTFVRYNSHTRRSSPQVLEKFPYWTRGGVFTFLVPNPFH